MRDGWEIRKLGDVCTKLTDGSHNPPKGIEHSDFAMLSSQNVFNDKLSFDDVRYLREEDFQNEDRRTGVRKGDVLLTIVGTVGRCAVFSADKQITLQRSVAVLRPRTDLNSRFLMHSLISKSVWMNEEAHGVAQKGLYLKQLATVPILVPPIQEQEKIVAELDTISEVIAKKKQQLEELDKLAQSIFYDMFGDPIVNEKGWETSNIGSLCTDVRYGTSRPACDGGKYAYLRMGNLTYEGSIDLTDTKRIDIPDNEIEKCIVRKGDVLFNRTNSLDLVGKTCLYNLDEEMVIAGYIIRVRLNRLVLPVYLVRTLNTSRYKKVFRALAKGAVNQANINAKEFQSVVIPVPPLNLQEHFAKKIEAIEKEKELVKQSIVETETLFNSRMDYWFN